MPNDLKLINIMVVRNVRNRNIHILDSYDIFL
jgi:hypothetical protein